MSLWLSLLVVFLVPASVVAAVLLWIAANGVLEQGRAAGQSALSFTNLGRALRSIYDETVRQGVPEDFCELLAKIAGQAPREGRSSTHVVPG